MLSYTYGWQPLILATSAGDGAFVRLSTRSPKDVGLEDSEQAFEMLESELPAGADANDTLAALMRSCSSMLVVKSGREAVELLSRYTHAQTDVHACPPSRPHARPPARLPARPPACTHARMHAHMHACTPLFTQTCVCTQV